MVKIIRKCICLVTCILLLFAYVCEASAANYDRESQEMGFNIDLSKYRDPYWGFSGCANKVFTADKKTQIGYNYNKIGVARSWSKNSDGTYSYVVMSVSIMQGNNNGVSTKLRLDSILPTGTDLWNAQPTASTPQVTTSENKNMSINVSENGISGSVGFSYTNTYVRNALQIRNQSSYNDTCRDRYKVDFIYNPLISKDALMYSQDTSTQRASYIIRSKETSFYTALFFQPNFSLIGDLIFGRDNSTKPSNKISMRITSSNT